MRHLSSRPHRPSTVALLACLSLLVRVGAVGAAPPEPTAASPEPGSLSLNPNDALERWFAAKQSLAERGVTFNLFLNDQFGWVAKGGTDTGGSGRNSMTFDAILTLDLERLAGITGGEALIHAQGNHGHGINRRTGAIMEVNDDADGHDPFHIGQAWYRHHFLNRSLSLQLGFMDFQTIVDRNACANSEDKQFMNQALDNNPMIPLNIGLGAAVTWKPLSWYTLIVGAGDAQSQLYKPGFDTAFHDEARFVGYMEHGLSYRLPSKRGMLPGNLRLGLFYDPRPRAQFVRRDDDPRMRSGRPGYYLSFDQLVLRESSVDEQGLSVFARFGYRDTESFTTSQFWSGGLSYKGLVPGRDRDEAGLGVAQLRGSDLYRSRGGRVFDNETSYELYYAIQVTKWFVLTPDVQYIDNAGADGGTGSVIVAGVRMRYSF